MSEISFYNLYKPIASDVFGFEMGWNELVFNDIKNINGPLKKGSKSENLTHEFQHIIYFVHKYGLDLNLLTFLNEHDPNGDVLYITNNQYYIELKMCRGSVAKKGTTVDELLNGYKNTLQKTFKKGLKIKGNGMLFVWIENPILSGLDQKDFKSLFNGVIQINNKAHPDLTKKDYPTYIHILIGKNSGFNEFIFKRSDL